MDDAENKQEAPVEEPTEVNNGVEKEETGENQDKECNGQLDTRTATDSDTNHEQHSQTTSTGQLEQKIDVDYGERNVVVHDDDDEDGDPIPSGTGSVSKDCSASELLGWSELLPRWHSKLHQRPKGLSALVRNGIPEPLRGEVWQLLSGAQQSSNLMERYRIFLVQSAPTEQIILRDVHRTYPAHENFRTGGTSSLLDSLFKVCKAYAVYDEEVGYCQGLSFLVAALLLHMPEEQAFCVFVRIMQEYGLRNLFRNNFEELYLKFYQLERLLEDHMPDLHQHFTNIGIEPFTYASQWFLTVFTAKFPLNAVFYIMDIFLLEGMNTTFQIALALLGSSKHELLSLDFEGVLKYFRVQMPKRYRNQDNVQQLIVASSEISLKKLKKYAKNYEVLRQKEKLMENPVARLQRENAKLTENNLRLEQENDDIARDLVASKIQLRAQLDVLEEKVDTLDRSLNRSNQENQGLQTVISDMEDEKARLEVEVSQLKEVCRRELQKAESEKSRDSSIISDYKKICSQLSKRLDKQLQTINRFKESTQDSLRDNESCTDKLCHRIFQTEVDELLQTLKTLEEEQLDEDGKSLSKSESHQPLRKASSDSNHSNRPIGAYIRSTDSQASSRETKIQHMSEHIDQLEVELARTKLALVEAECRCQQLTHDLSVGVTVKTAASNHTGGGLSGRLDFMKAAVSNRKSPKTASAALAKINNLISERISNIGSNTSSPSVSVTGSSSLPLFSGDSTTPTSSVEPSAKPAVINNNTTVTIAKFDNQC